MREHATTLEAPILGPNCARFHRGLPGNSNDGEVVSCERNTKTVGEPHGGMVAWYREVVLHPAPNSFSTGKGTGTNHDPEQSVNAHFVRPPREASRPTTAKAGRSLTELEAQFGEPDREGRAVTDDEFNTLCAEAFSLKNAEKLLEARDCFARLALERPEFAPVRGVLAGVLYELEAFEDAAEEFSTTVRLSPRSELASLGLFHSLLHLGNRAAAGAEMKRFTSLRKSAEYALAQSEMREDMTEEEFAEFMPLAPSEEK